MIAARRTDVGIHPYCRKAKGVLWFKGQVALTDDRQRKAEAALRVFSTQSYRCQSQAEQE